jgi:lipoprotein-anchoring transpeptidase ErfK/SrfK
MAWFGAATLCTICGSVSAQQGSSLSSFKPTMEDVAPGVDHGDNDDSLPVEFQRQAVFHRSQQPIGTIIIDTHERHLYLIESPTRAVRYGIGVRVCPL